MINDFFATLALENRDAILGRSRLLTRRNVALLSEWVEGEEAITWVPPASGTTALLKYAMNLPSRDLCIAILEETGVLFTPGSALGMEGYLRIGFANGTDVLREGLQRVSGFLSKHAAVA